MWDFGDGSTSTLASPSHIYTYPGIYPVKLLLVGSGGCQDSMIKNVTIKGPKGDLSYTLSNCYPDDVLFVSASENATQFTWDFGDGTTIINKTGKAKHRYDTGFYMPKLILSDSLGCNVLIKGKDTLKVYDVQAVAVNSTNLVCDSGSVTYTDASVSNDNIKDHIWIFNDGSTFNQPEITRNYSGTGVFTARLVAVTENGCTDTLQLAEPVVVSKRPHVKILNDSAACAPSIVSMSGAKTDADTSVLKYTWNFGNGSTASGQNVLATYTTPGTYKITLTAKNESGCFDTARSSIVMKGPPAVDAGRDSVACRSQLFTLKASGAVTYTWLNAQGLSCTDCASPQVQPLQTTTYRVVGKDEIGCSAVDSVTISVIQPSSVTASESDTACVGDKIQLKASGAYTYQWYPSTYLDDATSATPVFSAVTDTTINYSVIGYGEGKCFADTQHVAIKSYPIPEMHLQEETYTVNVGSSLKLQTNSSPDITEWKWLPQQWLDDPSSPNPTATPLQSVTYNCLAVNGGGCVARTQATINVVCGGANIYVPNTFSPNSDGMNDMFFVRGTGLFSVKSFRVFNRWGQMVFERLNIGANNPGDGWNGVFNNQKSAPDVYIYMMEVVCQNNNIIPIKGNVTLIR